MLILADIYRTAIDKCTKAINMVSSSNEFYVNGAVINTVSYSNDLNSCVIEGAFLQIFTAFESFLEDSFICYMSGQVGLNGKSIVRYVLPTDDEHAQRLIVGISRFADFTNRDTILKLASSFFENGGSYTFLNSISKDFEEMKILRNAITHISPESRNKFENMVRTKLGGLPIGTTTASFLNTFISTGSRITFFSQYKDTVVLAINNIANPS